MKNFRLLSMLMGMMVLFFGQILTPQTASADEFSAYSRITGITTRTTLLQLKPALLSTQSNPVYVAKINVAVSTPITLFISRNPSVLGNGASVTLAVKTNNFGTSKAPSYTQVVKSNAAGTAAGTGNEVFSFVIPASSTQILTIPSFALSYGNVLTIDAVGVAGAPSNVSVTAGFSER